MTTNGEIVKHGGTAASPGEVRQEGFGTSSIEKRAETAASAVAAKATAAVQARFIMAMQRPRDWDDVRAKLLKECKRPSFARVARYRKPVGAGIVGPSIRFAEAALRCMTNVSPETTTLFDDASKRIIQVTVTDLESNVSYSTDVVIDKTVERSSLKDGQTALGSRTNSQGKTTYLVAATEDDLLNKQNALISKALRTNGLRLLPGDIQDEAMTQVVATQADEDARDPDAARKGIADAFVGLGIMPSALKEYLGHDLDASTPKEMEELRGVFTALKEGETTWKAALAHKTGKATADEPSSSPAVDKLKETLASKAKRGGQEEPGSNG